MSASPSAPGRKYKIAFGQGMGHVKSLELAWESIVDRLTKHEKVEEKGGRYFVGGAFSSPERKEENLTCRSMLTLDLDEADEGVNVFDLQWTLLERITCAFVAYSTFRHTEDMPRLRVIVPLSRDVAPSEYREVSRRFAETLGLKLDPCSFVPNQAMFMPQTRDLSTTWSAAQAGEPYLVPEDLARLPNLEAAAKAPRVEHRDREDTAYGLAALSAECEAVISAPNGAQERTLNIAALRLGSLSAAGYLTRQTVEMDLEAAALKMINHDPKKPWLQRDICKKVKRSFDDGEKTPRGPGCTADDFDPVTGEVFGRGPLLTVRDPSAPWADPDDLLAVAPADPYPVDALPPTMAAAVREVQAYVQAPIAMLGSAALGALSAAAQPLVDVDRDRTLTGPCSLFLLTIGESGERKSSCDGYFTAVITQWERDERERLGPEIKEAESKHSAWSAQCLGVRQAITRAAKDNKPTSELDARLVELAAIEPARVQVPQLLWGDTTPEELGFGLTKGRPSVAIMSSEAGVVLGSHGMGKDSQQRNLGLLNTLWDGGRHTVNRRTSESYVVEGARLTMSLATQEVSLRAFVEGGKGLARGMGFFARFLISWPVSTQGFRPYQEATGMPALKRHNERVNDLLNQPLPLDHLDCLVPTRLTLTADAKSVWVAFYNEVETRLGPGGPLSDVRDIASKIADNAARLAAVFHALEHGTSGRISGDNMQRGCTLAAWYLEQAQRLFAGLEIDPGITAAAKLDSWLVERCRSEGVQSVPTAAVSQYGPFGLRTKATWSAALEVLASHSRVRMMMEGNRRVIAVNPVLLR